MNDCEIIYPDVKFFWFCKPDFVGSVADSVL